MPDYKVNVQRIETREVTITVTAASAAEANAMAHKQSGGLDYGDGSFVDAEYETEIEDAETLSDCCNDQISEEDGEIICSCCGEPCEETYLTKDDIEEWQRRDEKNGLYPGTEDIAN